MVTISMPDRSDKSSNGNISKDFKLPSKQVLKEYLKSGLIVALLELIYLRIQKKSSC